jgi:hypothetical protein
LLYNTWAFANTDWNLKSKKSLHKSLEAVNLNEYFSKVQIYKSRIRSLEEGGGVAYDPSLPCALVLDDWSSMAFGDVARAWYCGWVPKTGNELNRAALTPSLLNEIRKMGEVLIEVRSRIQKSRQIANSLSKFTRGLKSQAIMRLTDRKEIHDLGRDLNILEMEISQLCQPHTVLRALSKMAEVLMHNLRGESLKELSLEAAVSYTQLEEGVEILNTWVKHTLDLARPRSLKNENRLTTVADLRG